MKRLFTALKINPDTDFLAAFRNLQSAMKYQHIKWVEEHNIHITLKFFGDTEERKIPEIKSILQKRAAITAPVALQLSKLGIFGSKYDPKVIWVGIEPYQELVSLMKSIQDDLKQVEYEPDRQNLVPHLTLGRIRQLKDKILFNQAIDDFRNIRSESMKIKEIILYESILRREGPVYVVVDRFQLAK